MDKEYKTRLTIVTALATVQVLHETMDDLAQTPFYKHSLKQTTNRFENELTKLMDNEIAKMYKIDEEVMQLIQDGIQEVAKQLAHLDPTKIVEVGQLLKEQNT